MNQRLISWKKVQRDSETFINPETTAAFESGGWSTVKEEHESCLYIDISSQKFYPENFFLRSR